MKQCLAVVLLVLSVIGNAKSDCDTLLSRIPYSLRIDETQTGLLLNMTYDNTDDWSVKVVKYNGIPGSPKHLEVLNTYFNFTTGLDARTLSLNVTKPIDLEELYVLLEVAIGSLDLQIKCGNSVPKEIRLIVNPVNESPPQFKEFPYSITIQENIPVGSTIFNITEKLIDKEVKRIGGFTYDIEPYRKQSSVDGITMFEIRLNSRGIVSTKRSIDFDDLYKHNLPTYYVLNLTVQSIPNLQTWAILNITIQDMNDLKPVFQGFESTAAQYAIVTKFNHRGSVAVSPFQLIARDPDSLNYSIIYSIERVPYQYYNSFVIGPKTGEIMQVNDVYSPGILSIKASELNSGSSLSEKAAVLVTLGNVTSLPLKLEVVTKDDSNMRTVVIVLAIVAILIITCIIILFMVYHKKVVKSVSPKPDETNKSTISTSENWNGMSGSKTMLLYADMPGVEGRGGTLPPLTKDSATGTEKKRSRRRNKNKEPEIFDGTREYEGKLEEDFFEDAKTKTKIKQSTRSRDTKTETKYWITVPNDD